MEVSSRFVRKDWVRIEVTGADPTTLDVAVRHGCRRTRDQLRRNRIDHPGDVAANDGVDDLNSEIGQVDDAADTGGV
jgi:hypothetical protein